MEFRNYAAGDLVELIKDATLRLIVSDKHIDSKFAWTLYDKRIIACGGFIPMWPGVFEAWLCVDTYDDFLSYKICLIKKFRKEIDNLDYHRLQAAVDICTVNHHKFMNLLGFHCEGIMQKYGVDKQDHLMYAKVK